MAATSCLLRKRSARLGNSQPRLQSLCSLRQRAHHPLPRILCAMHCADPRVQDADERSEPRQMNKPHQSRRYNPISTLLNYTSIDVRDACDATQLHGAYEFITQDVERMPCAILARGTSAI